jgi:hypothetical protein
VTRPAGDLRPARVLIGVHHGFSARYLLQTEILRELTSSAEKVVVVVGERSAFFDAYARPPEVEVEVVPDAACAAYQQASRLQPILRQLRFYVYGRRVSTSELLWEFSRREALAEAPGRPLRRLKTRLRMLGYRLATRLLQSSRRLRLALLRLECRRYAPPFHDSVLDRHRPDVVVVSSLGTMGFDHYLMRAARRRGIPTMSVVLSWDNTSTRGYPGAFADRVAAWTETMRQELVDLHDYRAEQIAVTGVAHFDAYHRPETELTREAFLASLGADPTKRILFMATRAPNSYPWNPSIVRLLAEACRRGDLPGCQVVARVHPLYYRRDGKGGMAFADGLAEFERVAAELPEELVLNTPVFGSEELDYAMPESEMALLSRLLRFCDVIVTVFSTINIEGAIFDKPLVNVCFENLPARYQVEWKTRYDIVADSKLSHNARIVASGGVRLAATPEEMIAEVRAYLADPARDAAGRRLIVEREAGPNRGRAGRAIAAEILALARSGGVCAS